MSIGDLEGHTVEHWSDETGWGIVEVVVDFGNVTVSGTCGTEETPPADPANDNPDPPSGGAA